MMMRRGVVGVWVLAFVLVSACGDNEKATVEVQRDSMRIPVGATQLDKVTVTGYSPIGAERSWAIDDGSIADLADDGENLMVTARKQGQTTVHFHYGAASRDIEVGVTDAAASSLRISPDTMTLPLGMAANISAIATFSDGNDYDVSNAADWHIDHADILDYASEKVWGLAAGTTVISAKLDSLNAASQIAVTSSQVTRMQLDPPALSLPVGVHGQVTATGFFADGSVHDVTALATWTSEADATALVAAGNIQAIAAGTTSIHAAIGTTTAAATVHVTNAELLSITIDPASGTLPIGANLQLTATGHYDDGSAVDLTTQVMWSVDAHATVSSLGLATGTTAGFAHVTATLGEASGSATFDVASAALLRVEMSDAALTMPVTTQKQLTATAVFDDNSTFDVTKQAAWSSPDSATASVIRGLVTANATGNVVISASYLGSIGQTAVTVTGSALQSIDVSPATATLPLLTHQQLVATAHFADGSSSDITEQAVWSSDAPLVAYVGNSATSHGYVTALLLGDAHVTATLGEITGTAAVHVSAAVAIQLQVTPSTMTLPKGTSMGLVATALFTDNTTLDVTAQVLWTSLAPQTATVSNAVGTQGTVTGQAAGTASVTAAYGALTATSLVTVTAASVQSLAIEPATLALARGGTGQLSAMATYSDSSVVDVTEQATWTSDSSNATVSNVSGTRGKVAATSAGSATISGAFGGKSASAPVSISAATLVTLLATPNPLVVQKANTKQLAIQGVYSDLSVADLTASASYVSSSPAIASVSPAGLVTAASAGVASIMVTSGTQMVSVAVTVTPAILVNLSIAGGDITLPKGLSLPLVVLGTYSDGTTADITPNVTFTSSNINVASASNVVGNVGMLSATAQGTTVVSAHVGPITANVNVNVTGAQLTSIEVDAAVGNLLVAQIQAMTALGHYTDGTTQDLTSTVSWATSNPSILSISNLPGLAGKAIGLGLGSSTVTASLGSILGTDLVTVGAGCHIVVNEVKTGALFNSRDEFIELYNPCTVDFSLDGDTLVYRAALGTTDTLLATLTGTMHAGAYLVYSNSGFTGTTDGAYTTDIASLGGGIAIRASATSLVDSVGYGTAVNAFVEGAPVLAAAQGQAIARKPNGTDTNSNVVDFALQAPTPHAAN